MSTTRTAVRLASKACGSQLRPLGFRRQSNHLHRSLGGLFHAVHFQTSQWGDASSGSFTVNLAVAIPFVHDIWTGGAFPANPASALFPITQRIGFLMPPGRDQWWTVDNETDLEALAAEVASDVLLFGLPFFAPFKNVDAVVAMARSGAGLPGLTEPQFHVVHAILAAGAGEMAEAERKLRASLRNVRVTVTVQAGG